MPPQNALGPVSPSTSPPLPAGCLRVWLQREPIAQSIAHHLAVHLRATALGTPAWAWRISPK